MKALTRRYEWHPERAAKQAELERQATRLIRSADRCARRPKPTSSPSSAVAATPSGWFPLADLARVMRRKERHRDGHDQQNTRAVRNLKTETAA